MNQSQFNFTFIKPDSTLPLPLSIRIQGTLFNFSFDSILEKVNTVQNSALKSKVYIKESVNLSANKSASANLVSTFISIFMFSLNTFFYIKIYQLFTDKQNTIFAIIIENSDLTFNGINTFGFNYRIVRKIHFFVIKLI